MTQPSCSATGAPATGSNEQRRGIPTWYRGTLFRSLTEARWASFLDELAWPWAYEPFELAGYIPDFICAHQAGDLLVEVKGTTSLEDLPPYADKVIRSGWESEFMLVGGAIWHADSAQPVIGVIATPFAGPSGREWNIGPARLFRCGCCGSLSVLSEDWDWRCRLCNCSDTRNIDGVDGAGAMWGRAGARVQWRPDR